MRLLKMEAFALAAQMSKENPNTTAFGRFADFQYYYPERMKTDKILYTKFCELGGKPKEEHPLSFVLQGSEFLHEWFGGENLLKFPLKPIPEEYVSFVYGDSMTILKKNGIIEMLTKSQFLDEIANLKGGLDAYMKNIETKFPYIEVQLWNDECCRIEEIINVNGIGVE